MKERVSKLEDRVSAHEHEIVLLRTFKHDTNGALHAHNGKLEVITIQQNSAADAITELTTVVKDVLKKLNVFMTIKSMFVGAGLIFVPTVTGMIYLFQWYMEFKGIK